MINISGQYEVEATLNRVKDLIHLAAVAKMHNQTKLKEDYLDTAGILVDDMKKSLESLRSEIDTESRGW